MSSLVPKLDFLSKVAGGIDKISPSTSALFMLMYFVAFLVNLLGCLWYIIGTAGGVQNSWLADFVCPPLFPDCPLPCSNIMKCAGQGSGVLCGGI